MKIYAGNSFNVGDKSRICCDKSRMEFDENTASLSCFQASREILLKIDSSEKIDSRSCWAKKTVTRFFLNLKFDKFYVANNFGTKVSIMANNCQNFNNNHHQWYPWNIQISFNLLKWNQITIELESLVSRDSNPTGLSLSFARSNLKLRQIIFFCLTK